MKREAENYIKSKMKRALVRWNHALEMYEIGQMQSAANLFADAMRLYYNCASDLIDGTGFKEVKYEAKWELGAEYECAYCSHCGHQQWASWDSYREAVENIGEFHKEYKFCPNCGFEMKGVENEQ